MLPTRSLTRAQGHNILQQQQKQQQDRQQQQSQQVQRPAEQIKFYSLRSRNVQSRPSIVTQAPIPVFRLPLLPITNANCSQPKITEKPAQILSSNTSSKVSADPKLTLSSFFS